MRDIAVPNTPIRSLLASNDQNLWMALGLVT